MISSFIIAFREFLEAFLIAGVFFSISRKLSLGREKEIILAVVIGILISFLLPVGSFYFSWQVSKVFTEQRLELLEAYLYIFSAFFLAYVIISLHSFVKTRAGSMILKAHQKIRKDVFDLSVFLTIIFLTVREGFEIALFTATVSLFSEFLYNLIGLVAGFLAAGILGVLIVFSFVKISLQKVFKITEYLILLVGAGFFKNGVAELLEIYAGVELADFFSINLGFVPDKDSLIGSLIFSLTGFEKEFSFPLLLLMLFYLLAVLFFFRRGRWGRI